MSTDTTPISFDAVAHAGYVEINFDLGEADSVNIYRRIEGISDWKYVANDTHSPYIDNYPVANLGILEDREYRLKKVKDGQEYGDDDNTFTVLFSG